MPGGGFVATYTDVTEFRSVERGLRRANETLEQRVGERTALLESAKRGAEHANDAKSRFLTAIGPDLTHPLPLPHLFTATLSQPIAHTALPETLRQLRRALASTTTSLTALSSML